jgi:signal transduction histidine kinase
MARTADREASKLHDRELQQVARLLLGLAGQELDELGPEASLPMRIANVQSDTRDVLGDDYRYQIWSTQGQLLLSNFEGPSAASMARFGVTGFSKVRLDGEDWRVFAIHDAQAEKEIQVAERVALRQWYVTTVDASLLSAVVLSIVIVMAPALWLLRRLLRPLRDLADALRQRSLFNLKPVHLRYVFPELAPLVTSLNALFERVSHTMEREREFTAVAAHELRTPLATLGLLAETLIQTDEEKERLLLLQELKHSVDRCAHLQEQLLTLARLDVVRQGAMDTEFELAGVLIDAQADLLTEARRRHITLAATVDETVITAHRFGVQTMMRNLISNAVRYTPHWGRVEMSARTEGTDAIFEINDSGPGVSEPDRDKVFERFERLHQDKASGVGLGLSIVRAVAEVHGASVTLSSSYLGGLRVLVSFKGRAMTRPCAGQSGHDANERFDHPALAS